MPIQPVERMAIKPLIPLCLATFAGFLNLFGINPFFVDIGSDTRSTVSMVGYTATAALLMTAIAGAIIGPVAHRIGTRRTLVAGLIVAALGAAATALAVNFGSLLLARLLSGVGGSITGGVTIAVAAMIYEGRQRQRALALVTAAAAMAVVIGVALMTALAEPYGWRGAFLALSGCLLLTAVLNQTMLDPDGAAENPDPLRVRLLIDAYRPLIGYRPLRRLFGGAVLQSAALNGATAYIGAFLVSQHETSTQVVGLVFSLIGLTYFVANLLAGSMTSLQPRFMFSGGAFLMGVCWVAGYWLPVPALAIALLFGAATFAAGIAWVTLLGMVAERAPNSLGTAMVLSSSLLSLGGAIGVAISAGVLDITGYSGVALGVGAMAATAAVLGWVGPASEGDWEPRPSSSDRSRVDLLPGGHVSSSVEVSIPVSPSRNR